MANKFYLTRTGEGWRDTAIEFKTFKEAKAYGYKLMKAHSGRTSSYAIANKEPHTLKSAYDVIISNKGWIRKTSDGKLIYWMNYKHQIFPLYPDGSIGEKIGR